MNDARQPIVDVIRTFISDDLVEGNITIESGLLLASQLVRSSKARAALAWGSLGYSVGRQGAAFFKKRRAAADTSYTIDIDMDDDLFDQVMEWMAEAIPVEKQKAVTIERVYNAPKKTNNGSLADTIASMFDEDEDSVSFSSSPELVSEAVTEDHTVLENLRIVHTNEAPVTLTFDGYSVEAQLVTPAPTQQGSMAGGEYSSGIAQPYLHIVCPSMKARDAFMLELNKTMYVVERRRPALYQSNEWGDVQRVREAPPRKLDTVILKPGQIEALIEDIQRFLADEQLYSDVGMPYHRGILLYGMPGTGKTSIAAAVAHALELDIFHVSLSSISTESALKKVLSAVSSRSVLLLEEIDACGAVGSNGTGGLKRDTLLQALDGFTAPHGMITIMTTNHREELDAALLRPGRVDVELEIGAVDTPQVERLCKRFIGYVPEGLPHVEVEHEIVPADIMEVFKQHLRDREAAGPAVVRKLEDLLLKKLEVEESLDA